MSAVRLHIKICNGQKLLKMDIGGKSDPYVTLNLKSKDKKDLLKTQIISNSCDPIWNQEFDLISYEPENDQLLLNMWDEDVAKDDKMMDELSFPVTKWKIGAGVDHIEQELKLKKKKAGTLVFEVQAFEAPGIVKTRDVTIEEPKSSGVRVHIKAFEAKDVLKMDIGGKSDPYLQFSIKDQKKNKVRTQIISNSINPIWNQELDITTKNRNKDVLIVQMYDEDIKKDDKMCDAIEIPLKDHPIGSHYVFNEDIKLKKKKAGHLHFELDFFEHNEEPEVVERAVDLTQPCKLHVRVREAHNLKKMDVGGKSDPYITFALKGNKDKKAIQKTQIISNSCDPIWNQDLVIQIPDYNTDVVLCNMFDEDISKDDKMMDELKFTIKDWKIGQHVVFDQPIKLKKKDAGTLLMEFNLLNLDDPIPEAIVTREVEIVTPPVPCHLAIHVFDGKKLKKMDIGGKSDPYVTFQVKGTKKESTVKTQIISNSCDPIWNQDLFLNVEDYNTAEVLVNMFDEDIKKDDKMMNEHVYKLSEIPIGTKKVFNEEIKLKKKGAGSLHYEFTIVNGFHNEPSKPEAPKIPCKLVVTAIKGAKLLKMDVGGKSDPYLTFNLKSEKEKKRTKIISNTTDPIWNESFEFFVKDMNTEVLLVNMMDEDIAKDDKMMNQLEFPLDKWKIGSHISYDEDIKLKKKEAGHLWLEFDVLDPNGTVKPPPPAPVVVTRDVVIEEPHKEYCPFTLGSYSAKYSTNFSGYSKCSHSLSKLHSSEERIHQHHGTKTREVAKPVKVESFNVTVIRCIKLIRADDSGTDAYIKLTLVPKEKAEVKPEDPPKEKVKPENFKTDVAPDTEDPEYNKSFVFVQAKPEDSLKIEVKQRNQALGDFSIGKVVLPLSDFVANEPAEKSLTLEKPHNIPKKLSKLTEFGTIVLSLTYVVQFK